VKSLHFGEIVRFEGVYGTFKVEVGEAAMELFREKKYSDHTSHAYLRGHASREFVQIFLKCFEARRQRRIHGFLRGRPAGSRDPSSSIV
jgi:hypothetical protein